MDGGISEALVALATSAGAGAAWSGTEAAAIAGAGIGMQGAVAGGTGLAGAIANTAAAGFGATLTAAASAVAPYAAIGGTALSVGTSIMGGQQQKGMYELEAEQYREQADQARTAAAVDAGNRADRLQRTLAAQAAIFGLNGVDAAGGSPAAIANYTSQQGRIDIATGQANDLAKARQGQIGAMVADTEGSAAAIRGYAGAGSALLQGASLMRKASTS
jgi:hypothetical protein